MKVLLVEDEYLVALAMQRELRANAIECLTTPTAANAVNLADKENPDLVLMDIGLSGNMNGIEAAKLIHKKKHIPICFLSGYSNTEVSLSEIGFTPVGFLEKPVSISEITALISSLQPSSSRVH